MGGWVICLAWAVLGCGRWLGKNHETSLKVPRRWSVSSKFVYFCKSQSYVLIYVTTCDRFAVICEVALLAFNPRHINIEERSIHGLTSNKTCFVIHSQRVVYQLCTTNLKITHMEFFLH